MNTDFNTIANDPKLTIAYVKKFHTDVIRSGKCLPTLKSLEHLYSKCTAAGFLYWQHCASMERLRYASNWKSHHKEIWNKLNDGRLMIGVSATHLLKVGALPISAKRSKTGFILNGILPWMSGLGLYEFFVLGFRFEKQVLFAVVKTNHPALKLTRTNLAILNGTSSVQIKVTNLKIEPSDLMWLESEARPLNLNSRYFAPEVGMADSALNELMEIIKSGRLGPTRGMSVKRALLKMQKRIKKFKMARNRALRLSITSNKWNSKLMLKLLLDRNDIIRKSITLLALCSTGRAIKEPSTLYRLIGESLLLNLTPADDLYFYSQLKLLI